MAVEFTHEVGYYGMVSLDGTAILATSGSIGVSHDPIFSSGVWGAGWYNAAEQVSYANNSMRIEGDIGFELAAGDIFDKIQKFAFTERADAGGKTLRILPQGKSGYEGPAWCSSCSMNASEGALVTGSMNYSSGNMDANNWKTNLAQDGSQKKGVGEGNSAPGVNAVFPYWATKIALGGADYSSMTDMVDIIDWSANYSSSIEFITLCQGSADAPIEADYIMVGPMTADGSFTIFKISDEISPQGFHNAKSCQISMHSQDNTTAGRIDFANIVYNSGNTAIQTGGGYIQSDVSFTAIGDGENPPMSLMNV